MRRSVSLAVIMAAVAGCGDGTATVTGKVSYQGQPVKFGVVTIRHADGQTGRSGVIHPDGTYTVEQVARGPVTVGVVSPDPAKANVPTDKADEDVAALAKEAREKHEAKVKAAVGKAKLAARNEPTPGWIPLPKNYADPGSSGLKCDVNSNRLRFDIELK